MKYLAISFLGPNRLDFLCELTKLAAKGACNIEASHAAVLGSELSGQFLFSGSWNAIAKLETGLPALSTRHDTNITLRHSEPRPAQLDFSPYSIYVTTPNVPNIAYKIIDFFAVEGATVNGITTHSYAAPYTQAAMATLSLSINLPHQLPISDLRERFMLFCDDQNIDAIMEPEK